MSAKERDDLAIEREKARLRQLALAAETVLGNDALRLVLGQMRESLVESIERTVHDGTPESLHRQIELGRGLRTLRCFRRALQGMVAGQANAERFADYLIERRDQHEDL